jgi:hypothetical protein
MVRLWIDHYLSLCRQFVCLWKCRRGLVRSFLESHCKRIDLTLMLLRYLLVNQSILQPLGMLQFMNFWFAGFLFGGFLIDEDSLVWPFRLFL